MVGPVTTVLEITKNRIRSFLCIVTSGPKKDGDFEPLTELIYILHEWFCLQVIDLNVRMVFERFTTHHRE